MWDVPLVRALDAQKGFCVLNAVDLPSVCMPNQTVAGVKWPLRAGELLAASMQAEMGNAVLGPGRLSVYSSCNTCTPQTGSRCETRLRAAEKLNASMQAETRDTFAEFEASIGRDSARHLVCAFCFIETTVLPCRVSSPS